ncbi:hypothetical protein AAKU67_000983 [Oxalobacteraceae bacterium GrIS 2.11]
MYRQNGARNARSLIIETYFNINHQTLNSAVFMSSDTDFKINFNLQRRLV